MHHTPSDSPHPSSPLIRSDLRLPLETIVASAMDAIITTDSEGTIVLFNAAAERVFGVPAHVALGGSLDRFLPTKFRGGHSAMMTKFGDEGTSSRSMGRLGTVTGCRADGSEFPIEASISCALVEGRRYYSAILRDVSERTLLEAKLIQSQKMESIGRLAGGIAHDFNNLLMAIFNYLTLASRKLGGDHPVAESLVQANLAAQRAADLTRQLLMFSRNQAIEPRIIRADEIVSGLVPMLERIIGEDITLVAKLGSESASVRADPGQLEQVLVNLVVNARDAMPHGGIIAIETSRRVQHSSSQDTPIAEHVVISVRDTGVGIPSEVRARIFEPFFTTKPVGKGTGLGLATSRDIVHACGGHIELESTLGQGTLVSVCLPQVAVSHARHSPASAPTSVRSGSGTILLAEDSGIVRELVAEALRSFGYQVLAAASGPEALRAAQSHAGRIDLLITDVVMPGMSGGRLAEELASICKVPVIYMSGYTDEVLIQNGIVPSQVSLIAKPVPTDELRLLVEKVLGSRRKS